MRDLRLYIFAAASVLGCAANPSPAIDASLQRVPARPAGGRWMPSDGALRMGMDSLRSSVLPPGFREVRIQVVCDLCTPDYLFRIRTGPGGQLRGEAYLLQAHFTRRPGDTTGARIDREYNARAAFQRSALRCTPPVRSTDTHTDACKIGLPMRWPSVLAMIEQSGILRAVVDTGYGPMPPVYKPSVTTHDTATGVTTVSGGGFPGCGDIGGQSMVVEMLDGSDYGTAMFWCLEVHGPIGTEHDRAAKMRAALIGLVATPNGH